MGGANNGWYYFSSALKARRLYRRASTAIKRLSVATCEWPVEYCIGSSRLRVVPAQVCLCHPQSVKAWFPLLLRVYRRFCLLCPTSALPSSLLSVYAPASLYYYCANDLCSNLPQCELFIQTYWVHALERKSCYFPNSYYHAYARVRHSLPYIMYSWWDTLLNVPLYSNILSNIGQCNLIYDCTCYRAKCTFFFWLYYFI